MQTFTLTKQHLELLKHFQVTVGGICEFGAPAIDPKRPYGNSDILGDMIEILKLKNVRVDKTGEIKEDVEDMLGQLHKELETALQVVLSTQSFRPGKYKASDYGTDWKLIR